MYPNLKDAKAATFQKSVIVVAAILIGTSWFSALTSCGNNSKPVLSKQPTVIPIDSRGIVPNYIQEFGQSEEKYFWSPDSPDKKWEVYIERENSRSLPGGFFSLRLRAINSQDLRILFTLWDADVDSGVRANVRWSKDGKALLINGETRGFSYEPPPDPDPKKYESFTFVYLVDEDKLYGAPGSASTNLQG